MENHKRNQVERWVILQRSFTNDDDDDDNIFSSFPYIK